MSEADSSAIQNWETAFEHLEKRKLLLEGARVVHSPDLVRHCLDELEKAQSAYDQAVAALK
jgi:hypothetical protein